jgi:ATP/maltotriose-dependent transcriptional regulator MalT
MYLGIRKLLTSLGFKHEDFLVAFSLSNVSDVKHFVARKEELVEIHNTLGGDGSYQIVVLHGLSGIGKTQLSATYTKRHKDNYLAIFWLNIKDKDSLKQSFVKVAK